MQNQRLSPELRKPTFLILAHHTTTTFKIQMIFSNVCWSHVATEQARCFIPELNWLLSHTEGATGLLSVHLWTLPVWKHQQRTLQISHFCTTAPVLRVKDYQEHGWAHCATCRP